MAPRNPPLSGWFPRLLLGFALASFAAAATSAQADIIWNGPLVSFTEPPGGSGNNPANQDHLTSDVWLTRNPLQGLYNAAEESSYVKFTSPANTEWAYGTLDNYASLTYTTWAGMSTNNPPSMVGQPAVLHLISDNIYLSVEFLSWGIRGAGGFSYERSTAPVPEPSLGSLFALGLAFFGTTRLRKRKMVKR